MKKLLLISGPSCVGKGPLLAALKRFYPRLRFGEIPVIRSKESRNNTPRENERDIWDDPRYFRSAAEIDALKADKDFAVFDCRGLPQAINLKEADEREEELLILEVYHTAGAQLKSRGAIGGREIETIFISPLSEDEIGALRRGGVDIEAYIFSIMLEKQLRRGAYNGAALDGAFMASAIGRAKDAPQEIGSMSHFARIIPLCDGEGHPNWNRQPDGEFIARPAGDAGQALMRLVEIIEGGR